MGEIKINIYLRIVCPVMIIAFTLTNTLADIHEIDSYDKFKIATEHPTDSFILTANIVLPAIFPGLALDNNCKFDFNGFAITFSGAIIGNGHTIHVPYGMSLEQLFGKWSSSGKDRSNVNVAQILESQSNYSAAAALSTREVSSLNIFSATTTTTSTIARTGSSANNASEDPGAGLEAPANVVEISAIDSTNLSNQHGSNPTRGKFANKDET